MDCLLTVFIDTTLQDYLLCINYICLYGMHIVKGTFTILYLLEQSYLLQQNNYIILLRSIHVAI